jgi:hypothetical protein
MIRRLLLLCCLQTGLLHAAEPAGQPPGSTGEDKAEPAQPTEQAARQPRAAPASERFEPSEQISEDLSVSFPADI